MNEEIIARLWMERFSKALQFIGRCTVGQGNYVYIVECAGEKYVVRCSTERGAYEPAIYWLERLEPLHIPVPRVFAKGRFEGYEYLILLYLEGKDIGLVYPQLTTEEKREIAREVVAIQNRVAALELENLEPDWSWDLFIRNMLERAEQRIAENGYYFEVEKVERLRRCAGQFEDYFARIKPVAYLDDISSKNLLIHNGRLSGIIDIDWMGTGDRLTFAALTNMALLDLGYATDYVEYILEEMRADEEERRAFLFYTLLFCVDFMGERGMQFLDKRVEVNERIVDRLNGIYDRLWEEWQRVQGGKENGSKFL